MKYCDKTDVKLLLPVDRPLKSDGTEYSESEWDAILDSIIERQSGYIDDSVGNGYSFNSSGQKFNDIDDSPQTPAVIEEIAIDLVVAKALRYYGASYNAEDNEVIKRYKSESEAKLSQIRDGEILVSSSGEILRTVSVSSMNDRPTGQDEPVFNPDDLDEF